MHIIELTSELCINFFSYWYMDETQNMLLPEEMLQMVASCFRNVFNLKYTAKEPN